MIESSEAVEQTLLDHHGAQSWIPQLVSMVKEALQRGIEQIGHDGPVENARPFVEGQPRAYAMGARTAQEAQAEAAANSRDLGAAPQGNRVRRANRRFDRNDVEGFAAEARVKQAGISETESGEWLV